MKEVPRKRVLTPEEVSELIGISTGTLANWRSADIGPAFARVGKHVRYFETDVFDWLETRRVVTRSAPRSTARTGARRRREL